MNYGYILLLTLAILGTFACGSETDQTATACAMSDLISQCPPGSDPNLTAEATSMCGGGASVDVLYQNGEATGSCMGEGSCRVLCQFAVPCKCDVETISRDELVCKACTDAGACGNGMCEAGETPESCPNDCAAVCESGKERCNGNARDICNVRGQWEMVACPDGTQCSTTENNRDLTECAPAG